MLEAISAYYDALRQYGGLDVTHETAIRSAMQNLLSEAAREKGWTLVPEYRLPNGKTPDGTFLDDFRLRHGYWEAKDSHDDLETEIRRKFDLGYPADNILFEDTRRAVLFQGRSNRSEFDLTRPDELRDLLRQFTAYAAPDFERFQEAVREFQSRIPDLAHGLMDRIEGEQTANPSFTSAFAQFHVLCRAALNPAITAKAIEVMLVQHLLTERLFRTIFDNPDFTRRNVIAAEIEKVIDALTRRSFNRHDFLRSLDRFYVPIESASRTITDWNEKQAFLNSVYERFFQGFSTKEADTFGIVYTPQEIVSFMLNSVEHILKTEFNSSLSAPGVKILDPCTGTGNFVVNLLKHHVSRQHLKHKYANDIFANEIMLLPYYIASLNIEHEYYAHTGEYSEFQGMCFADTLALAESEQLAMFAEANSDRTQREQDAPITVIIGNPPYNVGQQNENDNNKNRAYKVVDARVADTYSKQSSATSKSKLNDPYVKFFRWATDRLQGRDGIVCFVSNNGFFNGIAFDGMRKQLAAEFTSIYHLDCKGNAHTSGERRRKEGGNVFRDQIRVGIGITLLVRSGRAECSAQQRSLQPGRIFYHALADYARDEAKLQAVRAYRSLDNVPWTEQWPDVKGNWCTDGMQADFDSFVPLGTKDAKLNASDAQAVFKTYSLGVSTNRDSVVYDFRKEDLVPRVIRFIDAYNSEVDRYIRAGRPVDVDSFVRYDSVKWSRDLKKDLRRGRAAEFDPSNVRVVMYRPFCARYLFFDRILNEEVYGLPSVFPSQASEDENVAICLPGRGNRKPFGCLATNHIPSLDLDFEKTQCFPYYTYDSSGDGIHRHENITDWALDEFRQVHGTGVTKRDIFHYVYALLHDPHYRRHYAENLKKDLPRIPLDPPSLVGAFARYVEIGAKLMGLHLGYEQAEEYPLRWIENGDVPFSWRVKRMRLSKDRSRIVVNDSLTLADVPADTFQYRLGNLSALEWVLDQYKVITHKPSGIASDPNRPDDEEYIVRLVARVITVSLETVRLVGMLRPAQTDAPAAS